MLKDPTWLLPEEERSEQRMQPWTATAGSNVQQENNLLGLPTWFLPV